VSPRWKIDDVQQECPRPVLSDSAHVFALQVAHSTRDFSQKLTYLQADTTNWGAVCESARASEAWVGRICFEDTTVTFRELPKKRVSKEPGDDYSLCYSRPNYIVDFYSKTSDPDKFGRL
jgi:hypothetical protein